MSSIDTELDEQRDLNPTDELVRINEATNEDGTIDVEIFDWSKDGDTVTVRFLTPTNDLKTEQMDWPKAGEKFDGYTFTKLLRYCDLSVQNAELLNGSVVPARMVEGSTGENWYIDIPDETTLRERVKLGERIHWDIVASVTFVMVWLLTGLLAFLLLL